jgi:hypothetical protein
LSQTVISIINLRVNSQNDDSYFYFVSEWNSAPSSNFVTNFATYTSLVAMVKLPEYWTWVYNKSKKTIYCTCVASEELPDGTPIMKAVKILNSQEVAYYLNSRIIVPSGLHRTFTSFEDISKLIIDFDRKTSCNGIDPSLQEVEVPAQFAGIQNQCRLKVQARVAGVIESGIFRSKNCLIVAGKRRSCVKCRQFKSYLLKRLRKVPKHVEITEKKTTKNNCQKNKIQKHKLDVCRRRARLLESKAKVYIRPVALRINKSCVM